MKRIIAFILVLVVALSFMTSCSESAKLEKKANALLHEQAYKVTVTTGYSSYDSAVNDELKDSGNVSHITIDGDNFEVERPVPNMSIPFSLIYTYYDGVLYMNEGEYGGWYKYTVPADEYDQVYKDFVGYNMANDDFKLANYRNHEISVDAEGYTVITAYGVKESIADSVQATLSSSGISGDVLVDSDECKLVITLDGLGRYKRVEASYYTVVVFSEISQTVVNMNITYDYSYGDDVKVELPESAENYTDVNDEMAEW